MKNASEDLALTKGLVPILTQWKQDDSLNSSLNPLTFHLSMSSANSIAIDDCHTIRSNCPREQYEKSKANHHKP